MNIANLLNRLRSNAHPDPATIFLTALAALLCLVFLPILLVAGAAIALNRAYARSKFAMRRVSATSDQTKYFRFDPELGWSLAPNTLGIFEREDFRHGIRINSHGMRYREVGANPRPGVKRVAVLGDSFAWGHGVEESDRFSELIERHFENKVELLNFGVSGYDTVRYNLMLDRVLEFKPELIIVLFCLSNDFRDNVHGLYLDRYYKPFAELSGDECFKISGYPLPIPEDIAGNQTSLAPSSTSILEENDFYADPVSLSADKRAQLEDAVELNRRLLADIARRVKAANAELLLVAAPTKNEFSTDPFDPSASGNSRNRKRLSQNARDANIPFVDPTSRLTFADFYPNDGHWTPEGHRKIAQAIIEWMI